LAIGVAEGEALGEELGRSERLRVGDVPGETLGLQLGLALSEKSLD
jgi:hypothetical protein